MVTLKKSHQVAFSSSNKKFEPFLLTDYRVEDPGSRDIVYEGSSQVCAYLPRGFAVVRDQDRNFVHELSCLRKFGYGWSYVTEEQIQNAKSVNNFLMITELK